MNRCLRILQKATTGPDGEWGAAFGPVHVCGLAITAFARRSQIAAVLFQTRAPPGKNPAAMRRTEKLRAPTAQVDGAYE